MTRGTHENMNSVSRPVPGIASASMAMERKRTRMLQKTTSPSTCDGGRRTPARPSCETMPQLSARRSKATACATRRVTRAAIHAPARPTTARVSIARMPGITRTSLIFRSASAAHTRSPHMSVMFRASFRPLRCGNVSRYHAWKAAERLPARARAAASVLPAVGNVYRSRVLAGGAAAAGRSHGAAAFRALSALGVRAAARGTGLAARQAHGARAACRAGATVRRAMSPAGRARPPVRERIAQGFTQVEDVLYVGIGVMLARGRGGAADQRGGDVRAQRRGRRRSAAASWGCWTSSC